jgi:hypothetical protein
MSLRLAMIAHGVPTNQTGVLAELLGIQSTADLAGLSIVHVVRVPRPLRAAFIRLRHAHCPPDAVWETFNVDFDLDTADWDEYDAAELQRLAQLALLSVQHSNELLAFIQNMQANVHAAVNVLEDAVDASDASDSDASDSDASSAPTASTAQMDADVFPEEPSSPFEEIEEVD